MDNIKEEQQAFADIYERSRALDKEFGRLNRNFSESNHDKSMVMEPDDWKQHQQEQQNNNKKDEF